MANNRYDYEIVIIGGGASGLMLAAMLDLEGTPGLLLEGSPKLGSKLLMSGGGRCNITHGGSIKDFIGAYGDAGPSLRRCLYRHSNLELISWFESHGIAMTDEDGRIFPSSMKSSDVLRALIDEASYNLWQIETDAKVCELRRNNPESDGPLWIISTTSGMEIKARNVVVACGGITYPETGSDGSMFELLEDLGISVSSLRPALAPIYVQDYPYSELSGISIPDVTVTAYSSDAAYTRKGNAARMKGDLLFTHKGFSGPVMLNISGYAEEGEIIRLSYNKELSELPKRMQRILEDRARGASGDIRTKVLAALLDHDDFTVTGIDRHGMVTAGGISLDEIDMSTMQIKKNDCIPSSGDAGNLYVIGEAIDANGITGGYNLQLCWSTAATAADSLRLKLHQKVCRLDGRYL